MRIPAVNHNSWRVPEAVIEQLQLKTNIDHFDNIIEIRESTSHLDGISCISGLPEAARAGTFGRVSLQIYEVSVSVVATPVNLIVIVCLWCDRCSEIAGFLYVRSLLRLHRFAGWCGTYNFQSHAIDMVSAPFRTDGLRFMETSLLWANVCVYVGLCGDGL